MTVDYCRGCGSVMQSSNPNQPGFIPEAVRGKNQVCQRCYQMTHYGKNGTIQLNKDQIKANIQKAIGLSQLLVIVADFTDLTGTLPAWSAWLGDQPYLLVVNKIDLMPERTKPDELKEYLQHYLADQFPKMPAALILASGIKGDGVGLLLNEIKKATVSGDRIGLLGMTNVGKSSLVKQMLAAEKSAAAPTVSKYPGTTLGLSNWSILKGRNTLIDTPGMVPGDRMGDLLCSECASRLVSTSKLGHKLWGIKPGKGITIGNYFGLAQMGTSETVLLTFAAPEILIHRTDSSKIGDLLKEGPSWLGKICKKCSQNLKWREENLSLNPNNDLGVAGLGWFSLRGAKTEFKIWYPEGLRLEIRPALVGKKDNDKWSEQKGV
ncbi:MAG: GTPase [Bacteroidota bacterium]